MDKRTYDRKVAQVVKAFHADDVSTYEHLMDELSNKASDEQWANLCKMIDGMGGQRVEQPPATGPDGEG